jgi:hypothetical protein
MPKKRTANLNKTAEKLATLALKHLSQYSEEEQEERISRAEKRVAIAARAGTSRTLASNRVLGRPGFLPEVDENLLKKTSISSLQSRHHQ